MISADLAILFPLNLMNAQTFNDTQQKGSGMSTMKS